MDKELIVADVGVWLLFEFVELTCQVLVVVMHFLAVKLDLNCLADRALDVLLDPAVSVALELEQGSLEILGLWASEFDLVGQELNPLIVVTHVLFEQFDQFADWL